MRRREFIKLIAGTVIAASSETMALTPPKAFRLGTLVPGAPLDEKNPLAAILLKELQRRGYALGKNLIFEARGAGGDVLKLPEIARAMKARGVDVIVAAGYPAILACKVANVPTVVAFGAGDAVATGLINGLARPGGNITGISDNATTVTTKRVSIIKQAVPNLQRIAMVWNQDDVGMSMRYVASAGAARAMGLTVQPFGVRTPDDFNGLFEAMDHEPPEAILLVADVLTNLNRIRVFDYAATRHIPTLYEYDIPWVHDGGLMSYGPDLKESFERAADLAARIFAGVRPAELPFEEPTRYKLVINVKVAKATGIELPENFVALADEVIE
jgi:putative ABC transport system substrate-binding protein